MVGQTPGRASWSADHLPIVCRYVLERREEETKRAMGTKTFVVFEYTMLLSMLLLDDMQEPIRIRQKALFFRTTMAL